jgi:hypothetical protein
LKVTVPVAADPLPVTTAVNVTASPATDGFALEESVTDVVAAVTDCVHGADVLAWLFVSPP